MTRGDETRGNDMMAKIRFVRAREILDSRGNPTVEVNVKLHGGYNGRAAVPSGASTGRHEACEARDGDSSRYRGNGVQMAVAAVNDILGPTLEGTDAIGQDSVDRRMIDIDRSPRKSRLGANAILGVSMAVARAAASASSQPLFAYLREQFLPERSRWRLPVPMFNVLNGGAHAQWEGTDMQEFMVVPAGAPTYSEALRWGSETYQALRILLKEAGHPTAVGDEGGFAPRLPKNVHAIELVLKAIERAGYRPGDEVFLALDPAASEFYEGGRYHLRTEAREETAEEMIAMYADWAARYPIVVIEDGLAEDDWAGWKGLNARLGSKVELVGDDLFVTSVDRLAQGIREDAANAVLIKPNQIGTVTETAAAVKAAYDAGWGAMVSHRSGETADTFISDLAVALDTGHLKAGAPCRGERVEKYNQLLRIEEALGESAEYAGRGGFVR